jgi:hypothetical protein
MGNDSRGGPHGIELNLRKSARRAMIFNVPALAVAAQFD